MNIETPRKFLNSIIVNVFDRIKRSLNVWHAQAFASWVKIGWNRYVKKLRKQKNWRCCFVFCWLFANTFVKFKSFGVESLFSQNVFCSISSISFLLNVIPSELSTCACCRIHFRYEHCFRCSNLFGFADHTFLKQLVQRGTNISFPNSAIRSLACIEYEQWQLVWRFR